MHAAILLALTMPLVFSAPVQFSEAAQRRAVQTILPTEFSSDELAQISSDFLERALFSARTMYGEYLQAVARIIDDYLAGKINQATAVLQMKQELVKTGYQPSREDQGTLRDLGSFERRLLVLKTNAQMARGYGTWMQGQQRVILDRWPAQELYRAGARRTHRQWSGQDNGEIIKGEPVEGRWIEAGGQIFDGRMIALKNTPIWSAISRFGNPYPPFDFNSGMWVRDIKREEAMSLGLIDRDTQIAPETRDFNQDLKFTPDIRSRALRQALIDEGYNFEGDVLTP